MIWQKIVHGAWKTGEPGVFFIDRANHYNPVPHLGAYEATNPCGEQPLLPYDVCNLGSINLGAFVNERGDIDWERLRRAVQLCTHFLENVIDANNYPLPEITVAGPADPPHRPRRHGAGRPVRPARHRRTTPRRRSSWAARSSSSSTTRPRTNRSGWPRMRGVFPEWEKSIWGPDATCARDAEGDRIRPMRKLRNCNVTTVAPTGTISIIAGCSLGHRAAVRRGVHAQPGRRADARRERGLRRHRQARRAGTPTS